MSKIILTCESGESPWAARNGKMPFPVPGSDNKRRRLDERDKLIHTPMGDISDVTHPIPPPNTPS